MSYVALAVNVEEQIYYKYMELLGISWQFQNRLTVEADQHIFGLIRTLETNHASGDMYLSNHYTINLNWPTPRSVGCFLKTTPYNRSESEGNSRRGIHRFITYKQELLDRKRLALRR